MIYLDHAATTPLDPRVLEAMMPYLTSEYGNPGSLHAMGKAARKAVDKAREQTARFFNCEPEQVIFTSGGSEGNNMVFAGLETELRRRGKTDVMVSAIEHDSVLKAARKLCIKQDFHLQICPPDTDGQVHMSAIYGHVTEKTGFLSVMTANNETGVVNDTMRIGEYCRRNGILFHTDAVQFAGIMPTDMNSAVFSSVDFLTVSGHKLNGPKGTGALFAKDPSLLSPLICGGEDQEFGLRGGTENVAGIVGFGEACEITGKEYARRLAYLVGQHSQLVGMLTLNAKKHGLEMKINGDPANCVPKTLSVCFPGVDAQTLLLMLDSRGICLSAGSACTAHENHPSHVLRAMGLSDDDARSSIRISLSHTNKPDEIDHAAREIVECAAALKAL